MFGALVRHVGTASLAGILSGMVVGGLLGRVAMRVAGLTSRPELIGVETANGNRVGDITIGGTLALVLFVGVSAGIGGGILYAAAEPWLRSRARRGLLFGAGLFAALGFTVISPGNFDFQRFGLAPLNVLLFAALFLAFGALEVFLFDRIRRAIVRAGVWATGLEIAVWLAAALACALVPFVFLSPGGLDDPVPALLFFTAALVPPLVRWRGLPRSLGYAAFGLPVLVGALRTLTGVADIVF